MGAELAKNVATMVNLAAYSEKLKQIDPLQVAGTVRRAEGLIVESSGPPVGVGEICEIHPASGGPPILAEVVGFRNQAVLCMPVCEIGGVRLGDKVVSRRRPSAVRVGEALLGRVIDGLGNPIDNKGPLDCDERYPLDRLAPGPLQRAAIKDTLGTGVRAIDSLLSVGRGQRVGIFGGSGVGKSTLLGMMARSTEAPIAVIALVGERGREVNSFIENDLGPEGLSRSVVVVSTSDRPPLMRIRAAMTATSIAEYFCDRGQDVLLVMDSVTRVAMAQREIGLAAGEPPSSKGYTPSVFNLLPRLFERAGNYENGSITGFYTVLVEGDDMNEPIADAVRGLLDGHVVLSRRLAWRNHFPAIDILDSISRLMPSISDPEQLEAAAVLRELLATYRKSEDMIDIGAYTQGTNPRIDRAIEKTESINLFLKQEAHEKVELQSAIGEMIRILK